MDRGKGKEELMTTEAQKKAVRKYDEAHTIQIHLKLNTATDADVIEWLNNQESKQGAIKELIRNEIKFTTKSPR